MHGLIHHFPMDGHTNNPFLASARGPAGAFADLAGLDLNVADTQRSAPVEPFGTTQYATAQPAASMKPQPMPQTPVSQYESSLHNPFLARSPTMSSAAPAGGIGAPLGATAVHTASSTGAAPPLASSSWAQSVPTTPMATGAPVMRNTTLAPTASAVTSALPAGFSTAAPTFATSGAPAAPATAPSTTEADEKLAQSLALPQDDSTQWQLRDVSWQNGLAKSIMQNENGPCSLIALCNALLLQGRMSITPANRPAVSYSYLSERLADIVLEGDTRTQSGAADPGVLPSVLATLPKMKEGFAVDVAFSGPTSFVAEDGGGELALFALTGIPLVHGWLPDPADATTYDAVRRSGTYNATALTVAQSQSMATPSDEARVLNNFLIDTATQLTPSGIKALTAAVPRGQLAVLFRNSHLSVLYHRLPIEGTPDAPQLFTLVTDEAFMMEDAIVWESLSDVDGSASMYFNGRFEPVDVRDRDWVRQTRRDDGEDAECVTY